jgi:DNA-binding MarR family transcriptional regulator
VRSDDAYAITDRGSSAYDRLADVVDELRATLTEGLTEEEQAATAVALERMARNLGWSG